jgi:kynurenine formamidase
MTDGAEPAVVQALPRDGVIAREQFETIFESVKNWGRWGEDDDLGTLNFITPERIVAAARLVRDGLVIPLGLPLNKPAADGGAVHVMRELHERRPDPRGTGMATDAMTIEIHGHFDSHLDALCHVSYGGLLYNGRQAAEVAEAGAPALDIAVYARRGIVGRGVLLDIAAFRGVLWLEPGDAVTAAELEAAEAKTGTRVGEGDVLVFRTGHDRRRRERPWDSSPEGEGRAGLRPDAVVWMHERRVAAFLPDGDGETVPFQVDGVRAPIHALQLVAMGLAAADGLDLEQLSQTCQALGRWEFLVAAAPLSLVGGTGSPINALAVF